MQTDWEILKHIEICAWSGGRHCFNCMTPEQECFDAFKKSVKSSVPSTATNPVKKDMGSPVTRSFVIPIRKYSTNLVMKATQSVVLTCTKFTIMS